MPNVITLMVQEEFHWLTRSSDLVSFHVMKLWSSLPVSQSHSTNVALCVLMPTHRRSAALSPLSA